MSKGGPDINETVASLAWRAWGTLGSSTGTRLHGIAIDLESLLVISAWLTHTEPRLRQECLAWSTAQPQLIASRRLKALLDTLPDDVAQPARDVAATIDTSIHPSRRLRVGGEPLPVEPRRITEISSLQLAQPEAVVLRARALCGAGARAEALGILAIAESPIGVSELSARTLFSDRYLRSELRDLELAGWVERGAARGPASYKLADAGLAGLGNADASWLPWPSLIRVAHALGDVATLSESSGAAAVVAARSTIDALSDDLQKLGIDPPPVAATLDDARSALTEWGKQSAAAISRTLD